MKLFKKHISSINEDDNRNEEKVLSLFEQRKQQILKRFTNNPEYSGKHEIKVHMDDGSTISFEGDDESVAWLLANMAQQTNAAIAWGVERPPHYAINMKKVAYIEFNTIKNKEDDNEEMA